jgi:hypothetical protein
LKFWVEPREGYLLAAVSGRESAEDMREFLLAVHDACRREECPRILMRIQGSRAVFKPEDYGLSGYANRLATPACQIALVGDTRELQAAHEYIEVVARQQGINLRAFADEAGAARWLAGSPEPSRRYRFRRIVIQGAPDDPGVYALWENEELVYYGRASSIRSRLLEHLQEGARATHYSWEMSRDPAAREAELLREYERIFGRLPRGNVRAS